MAAVLAVLDLMDLDQTLLQELEEQAVLVHLFTHLGEQQHLLDKMLMELIIMQAAAVVVLIDTMEAQHQVREEQAAAVLADILLALEAQVLFILVQAEVLLVGKVMDGLMRDKDLVARELLF